MDDEERRARCAELRDTLSPVVEHAAHAGVSVAVEPLSRYETGLLNTVDQTLDLPAHGSG
jgi:D-psicose/D-tagatose/L-ribulose 3-epimerase